MGASSSQAADCGDDSDCPYAERASNHSPKDASGRCRHHQYQKTDQRNRVSEAKLAGQDVDHCEVEDDDRDDGDQKCSQCTRNPFEDQQTEKQQGGYGHENSSEYVPPIRRGCLLPGCLGKESNRNPGSDRDDQCADENQRRGQRADSKTRIAEVGFHKAGFREVGTSQISLGEVGPVELSVLKRLTAEILTTIFGGGCQESLDSRCVESSPYALLAASTALRTVS